MTELDYEKRIEDLSIKVNWLILGYKIGITFLLVLSSLLNLGVAFTIPKFQQIFKDALGPDHPLPILTDCVIFGGSFLPLLALLWPILGIVSTWVSKKVYVTVTVPLFLLTLIVAQFVVTWISLFLPMTTIITGMGDTAH